jgi:hypothetical protein
MLFATYKARLAMALAGAAVASALAVSGATATYGPSDLRSPDAVDAARTVPDVPPPPSSIAASAAKEYNDLRSPDTRDQAEAYKPSLQRHSVADEPSGFDLVSAAIGAAAAAGLGIVLLAAGGLARRRPAARRHGTARA